MQCIKSYKFRLYPTAAQREQIKRTHGAVRYVCNLFLAYRSNLYDLQRKSVTMYDTFKLLTLVKNAEPNRAWLKQVDSKALQLRVAYA